MLEGLIKKHETVDLDKITEKLKSHGIKFTDISLNNSLFRIKDVAINEIDKNETQFLLQNKHNKLSMWVRPKHLRYYGFYINEEDE